MKIKKNISAWVGKPSALPGNSELAFWLTEAEFSMSFNFRDCVLLFSPNPYWLLSSPNWLRMWYFCTHVLDCLGSGRFCSRFAELPDLVANLLRDRLPWAGASSQALRLDHEWTHLSILPSKGSSWFWGQRNPLGWDFWTKLCRKAFGLQKILA